MNNHIQSTVICPHCGDRFRLESKQNKSGDVVQRGICPSTPTAAPQPLWSTDWELVRAKLPVVALTDDEVVTQDEELKGALRALREASPA